MRRKGQMTLEIVLMLFLVINIYLYVSQPVGEASQQSMRSVGTAALAVRAVDSIQAKANLVGISGDGAKDYIEVDIREEFGSFTCGPKEISLDFGTINASLLPAGSLGINVVKQDEILSYSKDTDFGINCGEDEGLENLPTGEHYRACVWFEKNGTEVYIYADDVTGSNPC